MKSRWKNFDSAPIVTAGEKASHNWLYFKTQFKRQRKKCRSLLESG